MCDKQNGVFLWSLTNAICLVASMQLSDISGIKEEVQKICQQQAIVERGLDCVKVVYGPAGQRIISVYDTYVNLFT